MFIIIGSIVVLIGVIGGYLMEHGHLAVLWQPAEAVIIGGAAGGAFLISASPAAFFKCIRMISNALKNKPHTKANYLDLLILIYQIFGKMRRDGLLSIEADLENTHESDLFKKYASHIHDTKVIDFICDNLKVLITVAIPPHELDDLMEKEIDTLHHESEEPAHLINRVADGLPGLGIVAAVLGVVITMGKIDQPPAVLGHSVGAALCGTFLGVLMCYGFVGPLGAHLESKAAEDMIFFHIIRVAMVSFVGGGSPQMAVEFGRRMIPSDVKPTFNELEKALKGGK